jgi:glutamine cyclotransferase
MARRLRIAHVIPLLFAVILVAPSWAYTILNHFPAPVGGPPLHFVEGLAWGNDVLWYSNSEAIFQLDPVTGAELSQTVVTGYINDLAWVNGELWGARVAPAEIVRFDPTDLSVLGTFSTGAAGVPEGLTFDGTSVWFSVDGPPARVHEMDPATGTLLSSRPSVAADPEALGYGDGFLWEGGKDEATIYKVDPATGATIASFNPPTSDVHGLEWDGQYLWASSYANRRIYQFDVSDVNARPTIAYLGTAGYESDGVNPDSGNSSTWFDFRVRYTDLENDAPWYVLVQVYRAGLPVTGSPFLMHDMGDTNTTGGADFQYRTRLPAGPGYTYNFRAANAFGTATGLATADHPGPAVSDQPPVLTWTGEPGYTADGVEPGVGPAGAPFVFRVTYSGTLAAERVRLHILRASQEITNSPFNMTTTDDTPYDGAIYTFQRKLSRSRDYTYYFEASNGNQNATGLPTTQSQGPVVGNRAPTLDFAGTPGYETDGVHPNVGSPEAPFVFKVVYRDEDNDEAITPRLHVTRSGTALPNSPFALTRATAAQPHSQKGVLYSAHVSLARGSAYQYWFSAADPYTPAVGPATGPQDGPVVNSAPVLEWLSKGFYMHDGIHPDTAQA